MRDATPLEAIHEYLDLKSEGDHEGAYRAEKRLAPLFRREGHYKTIVERADGPWLVNFIVAEELFAVVAQKATPVESLSWPEPALAAAVVSDDDGEPD